MQNLNRRNFIKDGVALSAAAAMGSQLAGKDAYADEKPADPKAPAPALNTLSTGKIGKLNISRVILGGNLLTQYTHSRDLRFVLNLCARYNNEDKILETLALAERHGVNTLSMNKCDKPLKLLQKYRKQGGKIQWILHSTALMDEKLERYEEEIKELIDDGAEALYIWGVRSDPLVAAGKTGIIAKAVELTKKYNVPCGVGCHDLQVVVECEKLKVPNDFYIKTFHHHNYPSAPKPEQLKGAICEVPGYWCKDPQGTIDVMKSVEKPWIAFKVMAAGAIPPKSAFPYVFNNGADHVLAGMFDFDIADDVKIANDAIAEAKRVRPWRS